MINYHNFTHHIETQHLHSLGEMGVGEIGRSGPGTQASFNVPLLCSEMSVQIAPGRQMQQLTPAAVWLPTSQAGGHAAGSAEPNSALVGWLVG